MSSSQGKQEQSNSVSEDPGLASEEKQLSLTTTKDQQEEGFIIHSEVASITRYLLGHDEFDETDRRVVDGDVVAVTGRIPIGCVKLQAQARSSNVFSRMKSSATQSD